MPHGLAHELRSRQRHVERFPVERIAPTEDFNLPEPIRLSTFQRFDRIDRDGHSSSRVQIEDQRIPTGIVKCGAGILRGFSITRRNRRSIPKLVGALATYETMLSASRTMAIVGLPLAL